MLNADAVRAVGEGDRLQSEDGLGLPEGCAAAERSLHGEGQIRGVRVHGKRRYAHAAYSPTGQEFAVATTPSW